MLNRRAYLISLKKWIEIIGLVFSRIQSKFLSDSFFYIINYYHFFYFP